jgi:predicted amino acid-binding ACT domain protein
MSTSLVVTVIGADRPGIVNLLSDAAQRQAAN